MRFILLLATGVLTSACGAIAPTSIPTPISAPIGMPTPTATTGPLFTQSEAIALVQQYLRMKTYTTWSSPLAEGQQYSEVRQCEVWNTSEFAYWEAVHQQGTWVVTRTFDWKRYHTYLRELLGNRFFFGTGRQVDMWALDEHTRLVERLGPDNVSYARREC